jgi:hypothetical protein
MMEKLKSFPFILIFLAYAAYLGLEYYQFQFAPDGKFEMHQMQMKQSRVELDGLKKKLAEGQKFMQTLDIKKEELRGRVKKTIRVSGNVV